MSRFFHSNESSSSSSDSDEESSDKEPQINGGDANPPGPEHIEQSSSGSEIAVSQTLSEPGDNPRDFLLHALLEERCLQQARASPIARRYGVDSPEILADARSRYLSLCSQLAAFNLVPAGQEQDRHAATRQRFRDGLALLDRQMPSAAAAVPGPFRRLLTDNNERHVPIPPQSDFEDGKLPFSSLQSQLRALLTPAVPNFETYHMEQMWPAMSLLQPSLSLYQPNATSFMESRYHRDFEELNLLGSGGYGVVYHVRHRLDRQAYAIKKIPLSRSRIARLQQRGQAELDEFLLELQTLARLEHPNIVRYYGGWIEWTNGNGAGRLTPANAGQQANAGAEYIASRPGSHRQSSLSRIQVHSQSEEIDIVFENSRSVVLESSSVQNDISLRSDGARLQHIRTHTTVASVSDSSSIETIDRPGEGSSSIISSFGEQRPQEPTLALHVQMSLHPMTLADFLMPPVHTELAQPLCHCFHLLPSVQILLAVLDGVEYLHGEGIIHRDIKPANIFLGTSVNARPTQGTVDLELCPECQKSEMAHPIALQIRIGDFGLVTALSQNSTAAADNLAIGTEMYRPPVVTSNTSPCLDLYALGIVAFELLHKFETRMERHRLIQQLKAGCYPPELAERLGKQCATRVQDCIDAMLSSHLRAVDIKDLREQLSKIWSG